MKRKFNFILTLAIWLMMVQTTWAVDETKVFSNSNIIAGSTNNQLNYDGSLFISATGDEMAFKSNFNPYYIALYGPYQQEGTLRLYPHISGKVKNIVFSSAYMATGQGYMKIGKGSTWTNSFSENDEGNNAWKSFEFSNADGIQLENEDDYIEIKLYDAKYNGSFFSKGSITITYEPTASTLTHTHNFSYNKNGNTLTATCAHDDGKECDLSLDNWQISTTLTPPTFPAYGQYVYHPATLSNIAGFITETGATACDITYVNNTTGASLGISSPHDIGVYTASVTITAEGTNYKLTTSYNVGTFCGINTNYPQITTDKEGNYAFDGETVTLTITPKYGEILTSMTATGATSGNKISLTATGTNTYTFTMPQEEVNISAAWKKLLSNTDISICAIDDQEWTGSAIKPTIVVKDGATDITDQCDFAFSDNTNTGEATVTITAKNTSDGYSGSTSTTFKITQKNIGQWGALAVTEDQNGKTATFDGTSTTEVNIPAMAGLTANIVKYNRTFTPGKASTVMLPFEYEITGNEGGEFYAFAGVEKEGENWVATMKPDNNQLTNKQTLTANKPYLFLPTATSITFTIPDRGVSLCTEGGGNCQTTDVGSQWKFKGTYQPHYWYDGTDGVHAAENADEIGKVYGFAGNAKGDIKAGDFVKAKNGAKIRPMSCYLLWTGKSENNARSRRVAASATEQLPQSISVRLISASGETTGIGTLDTTTGDITFDGWYTLDGTRLDSKPAKSGIYINNGKKVIIK